jgi:putative flippase GtrA
MPESPPASANRSWAGWFKFIAVGLSGYLVLTLGVAALVELLGVGKRPAYAVMIMLVMAGNFYVSRALVFPQGRNSRAGGQAARFLIVALSSRVFEYFSYSWLIGPTVGIHYVFAITLVSALSYLIKYYVFSAWVFR